MSLIKQYKIITFLLIFNSNECHKDLQKRVIGGKPADIKKFPFMVALVLKYDVHNIIIFKCGANIVSKYWALTAAQCCKFIVPTILKNDFLYLRGNSTDWTNKKYIEDHKVLAYYIHPKFNKISEYDCDIAILNVKQPFTGKHEKPVKVPSKNFKVHWKQYATIVGWGSADYEDLQPSKLLRSAAIFVYAKNRCGTFRPVVGAWHVTHHMICAGLENGLKGPTRGDCGGPLLQTGILIGLVSFGKGQRPTVYTKVNIFQDWLISLEKQLKTNFQINYIDH